MRVFALITDAFGGHGGIALYNRDLLTALAAYPEIEGVTVVPRKVALPTGRIPNKIVYKDSAATGNWAYAGVVVANLIQAGRSDLIYCAHINLLPLAWLLGRLFRVPVILALYGIDAWQPTGRSFTDRLVKQVQTFISISDFTKRKFVAWSKVDASRVELLPNAIHAEKYRQAEKPNGIRSRYSLAGKTVLLTLGRIVSREREKGFDEVLDLLPQLRRDIPNLVYVIAGDGDYRPALEVKAKQLGVSDSVVFTGFVSEEEKPDLYRCADVFVMPSRGEGFGFVFLEAMACGVPVIASKADGSCEAVRHGALGILVEPGNARELRRAILQALQQPRGTPGGLDYFSFANFSRRLRHILEGTLRCKRRGEIAGSDRLSSVFKDDRAA